jgi:hypothetical protein
MDGALAIVLILIFGFVLFIIWGKSDVGQSKLGRPTEVGHSFKHRQREVRRQQVITGAGRSAAQQVRRRRSGRAKR